MGESKKLPTLPAGAKFLREGDQWGIIWAGRRCSPRWNGPGPAAAYADMLSRATVRPQYEQTKDSKGQALRGWT